MDINEEETSKHYLLTAKSTWLPEAEVSKVDGELLEEFKTRFFEAFSTNNVDAQIAKYFKEGIQEMGEELLTKVATNKKVVVVDVVEEEMDKPYTCEYCEQSFAETKQFVHHMRSHVLDQNPGVGIVADDATRSGLKRARNVEAGSNISSCPYCKKKFYSDNDFYQQHLKTCREQSDAVTSSSLSTSVLVNRNCNADNTHRNTSPKSEDFIQCRICFKNFVTKQGYERHMRKHGEPNFKCALCSQGFVDKPELETHMRTHITTISFSCDHCNLTFPTKSGLNRHMNSHLRVKQDTQLKCLHCKIKFGTKKDLEYHMQSHTFSTYKCHSVDGGKKLSNVAEDG